MASRPKNRFWRLCRIYFRRFRITCWVVILLLLGSLLYLNQIGLPNFVKNPLLQKLRARGLDLQFSRLRLRFSHGIVAENVRFGRADDPLSPNLTVSEVRLLLNYRALLRLQLQVDSLVLRHGRLVLPISETNRPPRKLLVENIQTDLRLLPNDRWVLDNFKAGVAGGNIELSGNVTNASAVREWKLFQPAPAEPRGSVQDRLRRLADALERIQFSSPPALTLDLQGDARDPQSFLLRLRLSAPGSQTPWGTFTSGSFTARLLPATSNGMAQAEMHLEAAAAKTEWASCTQLRASIHLVSIENQTNLVQGDLGFAAQSASSKWAAATNLHFTAQWVHAFTNPIPISGEGQLRCEDAQTQWGSARKVDFNARLTDPNAARESFVPPQLPPLTSWWTNLESHMLDCDGRLTEVQAPKLQLDRLAFSGNWRAPRLTLTIPEAVLYEGKLAAEASLDVTSRALNARLASDVDPHRIAPVLTEGAQRWLGQFAWNKPPEVAATVGLVLPQWTNRQPDWRAEVLPTLQLDGQFHLAQGGAFRKVPLATAQSRFLYSNMCWTLPDLTLTRPEGTARVFHHANDRTKDHYWKLSSDFDVQAIRPLLEPDQLRAFDLLQFSAPPHLEGEIWGRWRDHARTGFKGQIQLTNFQFRGQSADSFQAAFDYTNRWLRLVQPRLMVDALPITADGLAVDFTAQKIHLTNGFSMADPRKVTRAIGTNIDQTMEPYRFSKPPTARVHGVIPTKNEADADLHFSVEGGPFHWMQFNVDRVAANLHWKGQRLTLNGMRADFYGGKAAGSARFDFRPSPAGTAFQFDLWATNAQFNPLVADLAGRPNKLEGQLAGRLIVNSADTEDWNSWQGGGNMELTDGLIWDIPVFGVFSPILNSLAPGLGNSRASAATGSFIISNSVVHSEDLEIRTSGTRLQYRGTVNFEGQVNARMEAELLRDMWVVGPIISTMFGPVSKLFEYKVGGTLAQPKTEPVFFIPKVMLMPFHPLRTLRELFPPNYDTNAPPQSSSPPLDRNDSVPK